MNTVLPPPIPIFAPGSAGPESYFCISSPIYCHSYLNLKIELRNTTEKSSNLIKYKREERISNQIFNTVCNIRLINLFLFIYLDARQVSRKQLGRDSVWRTHSKTGNLQIITFRFQTLVKLLTPFYSSFVPRYCYSILLLIFFISSSVADPLRSI